MKNNALKENILNLAKHYFYNDGFENTYTRMIAKKLNIYQSNIFYYFKNKEEILRCIFEIYFKQYNALILEIKPDLTELEFILCSVYISNYAISFNRKFRNLIFEAIDIVIDLLYKEYSKNLFPKIIKKQSNPYRNETNYLIDLTVLLSAAKEIYKLTDKKYIQLTNKELREYLINLVAKVMDIDEESFKKSKNTVELIARKIDYDKLNIFSDDYTIKL